jgi:hypothetical protein
VVVGGGWWLALARRHWSEDVAHLRGRQRAAGVRLGHRQHSVSAIMHFRPCYEWVFMIVERKCTPCTFSLHVEKTGLEQTRKMHDRGKKMPGRMGGVLRSLRRRVKQAIVGRPKRSAVIRICALATSEVWARRRVEQDGVPWVRGRQWEMGPKGAMWSGCRRAYSAVSGT